MILGIGTDIIEVVRIEEALNKHPEKFLSRIFTEREQDYCNQFSNRNLCFAARWAAKEAIAKALGTGIGTLIQWLDIEILKEPNGKPVVSFSDKGRDLVAGTQVHVSISHCQAYATAMAIWEK